MTSQASSSSTNNNNNNTTDNAKHIYLQQPSSNRINVNNDAHNNNDNDNQNEEEPIIHVGDRYQVDTQYINQALLHDIPALNESIEGHGVYQCSNVIDMNAID